MKISLQSRLSLSRNNKLASNGSSSDGRPLHMLQLQLQHLSYTARLAPRRDVVTASTAAPSPVPAPKSATTPDALMSMGPGASIGNNLELKFDNESDPRNTVVTVTGYNQINFLNKLTGVFGSFNIEVVEATISTDSDGGVRDVFRVRKFEGGGKVPESEFAVLEKACIETCSTTSKSSMPAIYGDIRPQSASRLEESLQMNAVSEDNASALEMAAFELAQAASALAVLERELMAKVQLQAKDTSTKNQVQQLESRRIEAAADLERRMAALQALLQLRKVHVATEVEPSAARGGGAELNQKGGTGTGPACGTNEIILQAFNWESNKEAYYATLKDRIKELAAVGFTALWLPPPSESVSPQGYLPRDLYNLNSTYGTEAELRELIMEIKEHGMMAVADVVVNHRCAHYQDEAGRWNKFGGRLAWDSSVICSNNPAFAGKGTRKNEDDYTAAPNIDHSQERVRKDIVQWLLYLKNRVGFDGWRFDFVKGYSGVHTREYIDGTVPSLAFGEYWDTMSYADGVLSYNQDAHRQRTVNWCDKTGGTAAAFDFTTKGILQEAVSRREYWRLVDTQGRPPGLIGMWPSRAVTFIENHDTGSTLQHWPFPWQHAQEGYAYIITHPGTPCIFWDHYVYDPAIRKCITDLVALRKKMGINCRSKIKIMTASGDVYGAVIDDKVAMKIGPGHWSPNQVSDGGYTIQCSGVNWAVWTKG